MPPTDPSPEANLRHLRRLLGAICLQNGGEYHIECKHLRDIEESGARQALIEDTVNDRIVLRFGSKHSAVYILEPECLTTKNSNASAPSSNQTVIPLPVSPGKPMVQKPLTDDQLARAERKVRAARIALRMKQQGSVQSPVT